MKEMSSEVHLLFSNSFMKHEKNVFLVRDLFEVAIENCYRLRT